MLLVARVTDARAEGERRGDFIFARGEDAEGLVGVVVGDQAVDGAVGDGSRRRGGAGNIVIFLVIESLVEIIDAPLKAQAVQILGSETEFLAEFLRPCAVAGFHRESGGAERKVLGDTPNGA